MAQADIDISIPVRDQIDLAMHEIEQMVEFAIRASDSLVGSEHDNQNFEMPAEDANLLSFALFDVAKWLEALREILSEPAKTAATCA
jgi:hypothetical protein